VAKNRQKPDDSMQTKPSDPSKRINQNDKQNEPPKPANPWKKVVQKHLLIEDPKEKRPSILNPEVEKMLAKYDFSAPQKTRKRAFVNRAPPPARGSPPEVRRGSNFTESSLESSPHIP
jgi:hypothetical protein